MDGNQFDRLTKAFAGKSSRRAAIRALLGLAGGAAASTVVTDQASARTTGSRPQVPPPPAPACATGQIDCNGTCCQAGETCCGGYCCAGRPTPSTSMVMCARRAPMNRRHTSGISPSANLPPWDKPVSRNLGEKHQLALIDTSI